jgi:hypothetical protein
MTDPHSDAPPAAVDEPESPAWLPALGFALFVVGGVAWAVTPPVVSATPPPLPAPSVVAAPPPPPPQAAPAPAPQPAPGLPGNPPPPLQRPGGPLPKAIPGVGGVPVPGPLSPRPTKKHP